MSSFWKNLWQGWKWNVSTRLLRTNEADYELSYSAERKEDGSSVNEISATASDMHGYPLWQGREPAWKTSLCCRLLQRRADAVTSNTTTGDTQLVGAFSISPLYSAMHHLIAVDHGLSAAAKYSFAQKQLIAASIRPKATMIYVDEFDERSYFTNVAARLSFITRFVTFFVRGVAEGAVEPAVDAALNDAGEFGYNPSGLGVCASAGLDVHIPLEKHAIVKGQAIKMGIEVPLLGFTEVYNNPYNPLTGLGLFGPIKELPHPIRLHIGLTGPNGSVSGCIDLGPIDERPRASAGLEVVFGSL